MSDVPEMVERLAQAMCEDSGARWVSAYESIRGMWRSAARVAIKAMREPTEAMMNVHHGLSGVAPASYDEPPLYNCTVWRAMIDAALTKHTP